LERSSNSKHQVRTLDGKESTIENGVVEAEIDYFPLIIMTSNGEREFPPAFLRRCIHLTMQPRREFLELERIILNHIELSDEEREDLREIIEAFSQKDVNSDYLAIDQLLNAVFLKLKGVNILDREQLLSSIWKSLSV